MNGADLLVGAGIIVGLLALRLWVLPRLGVPT